MSSMIRFVYHAVFFQIWKITNCIPWLLPVAISWRTITMRLPMRKHVRG